MKQKKKKKTHTHKQNDSKESKGDEAKSSKRINRLGLSYYEALRQK